ncbi:MAG: hypothetical protein KatS3mg071_1698 [Meiothermus sp.]|nr:MAG: hypothetical protein KatS3mg071_1698 [Meiothermus sp.]
MRQYRELKRIGLSYLEKAPDHGQPELAVIFPDRKRHRVVPIARGEEATRLWQQPLDEETLIKLASAHVAN